MSDIPQGPGWWLASDGKYYPPEQRTTPPPPPPPPPPPSSSRAEAGIGAGDPWPDGQRQAPSTSHRKRRSRVTLAAVGLAVLATAGAGIFVVSRLGGGGEPTLPGPDALGVSFTLIDSDISGDSGYCYGTGGYSDFGPGMDIRILNQDNKLIGSGSTKALDELAESDPEYFEHLTGADFESGADAVIMCRVAALVPISGNAEFYRVEIGRRGQTSYTRKDLEEADWEISLSLGL